MLSLLSLLPLERYLSPPPSIEENYSEDESKMQEHDFDASAASPHLPGHAAIVYSPWGNRSLSSSACSPLEFHEDLRTKAGKGLVDAWVWRLADITG